MRDAAVAYSNGKLMIDTIPAIKESISQIAHNLLKDTAI